MVIVLGFALVSLLGGLAAWLVSSRPAARSGVPQPAVDPAPVDESPGFLDRHFGEELAVDEAPAPASGPVAALDDGASPGPTYVIKGNATSRIFHVPGSPAYARTRAGVWFETEEDALAAGYRAPKTRAPKPPS